MNTHRTDERSPCKHGHISYICPKCHPAVEPQPPHTPSSDWEKEFDRHFMSDGELLHVGEGTDDANDIKSFIHTHIENARRGEWIDPRNEMPEHNTQVLCALQHFTTKRIVYEVLETKEVDDAVWFDGDGEIDEMNWSVIGWRYIQAINKDA